MFQDTPQSEGKDDEDVLSLDIDDILEGTVVKSVDIGLLVQGSPVPLTTVNVVANITDMVGKSLELNIFHPFDISLKLFQPLTLTPLFIPSASLLIPTIGRSHLRSRQSIS